MSTCHETVSFSQAPNPILGLAVKLMHLLHMGCAPPEDQSFYSLGDLLEAMERAASAFNDRIDNPDYWVYPWELREDRDGDCIPSLLHTCQSERLSFVLNQQEFIFLFRDSPEPHYSSVPPSIEFCIRISWDDVHGSMEIEVKRQDLKQDPSHRQMSDLLRYIPDYLIPLIGIEVFVQQCPEWLLQLVAKHQVEWINNQLYKLDRLGPHPCSPGHYVKVRETLRLTHAIWQTAIKK